MLRSLFHDGLDIVTYSASSARHPLIDRTQPGSICNHFGEWNVLMLQQE